MAGEVCVPNEPALLKAIEQVIPSWKTTSTLAQSAACGPPGNCVARVTRNSENGSTFDIESVYLDEPLQGLPAASAVCALLADVLEAYIEECKSPLTLHGGAFAIGGRLIAITGPRRAGKSTLIARLCAEPGLQIFCDDVLPITPQGEGLALGVAPRLRLPLPATACKQFATFVQQHLGPHDTRYGYVCSGNLAKHGTRLPLAALVVLDRQVRTAANTRAPAGLHTLTEDDALFYALQQNMGDFESPAAALAHTQALLGEITCVRLVYSDLEDAVQLLTKAFDCAHSVHSDVPVQPAQAWLPQGVENPSPVPIDQVFLRAPGVALRRIGESTFLWRADGDQSIWRLNTVAQALWSLLEIPGSARELAEILTEVFVQVPRNQLERDIAAVLAIMQESMFIVAVDTH